LSSALLEPPKGVPEETVFGLDNVGLHLPIAGVGSRLLAGLLDYLIVSVLGVVWMVLAIAAVRRLGPWSIALVFLGLFLIEYGYFSTLEIVMQGQTPGKSALSLRVVSRLGGRPGASALLARNLVRTADLLLGVPFMAFDPLARRLGDRLGGTLVVYQHGPERSPAVSRVPAGWGRAEVALLEDFFRRLPFLEAERSERIAQRILERLDRDDRDLLKDVPSQLEPVERLRRAVGAQDL
jgi:uncharacterized RDD family membrane protein YckC